MNFPNLFVTDLDSTALGRGGHRPYARFPDFFSEFLDRLDSRNWCPTVYLDNNGII